MGSAALLGHIRGLEQELRRLEGDLDHSRRLATLGELAAAVAHELNNTLTPMTSYAQLALDDPGDAELNRKAHLCVVDGVERASRMMRSMLGLMRDDEAASPDDEDDAERRGGCELREVVDAAVDCLVGQPGRANVRLKVDVPDLWVRMPRADLQQVLVNLLLNAYRAVQSGRKTGRVTVGARRLSEPPRGLAPHHATADPFPGPHPERVGEEGTADRPAGLRGGGDGDVSGAVGSSPTEIRRSRAGKQGGDAAASWVEFWVSDNGPGVPDRVRGRLFEPFVTSPVAGDRGGDGRGEDSKRGAPDEAATHGGTGLGLSICRDLVERTGGTIGVEDAPDTPAGAVFRVVLPTD